MKRFALALAALSLCAATPVHAQFLQKLEQQFLGGGGQANAYQQPQMIGNCQLPAGQYMMSNTASGQAFMVVVENGQMYLANNAQQGMVPATGGGLGSALGGLLGGQQQQTGLGGLLGGQQQQTGLGGLMGGQQTGYGGMMGGQQQQGGLGGMVRNGLTNFLENKMAPQQQVSPGY